MSAVCPSRRIAQHPAGFYTLCLAEFFERWAASAIGASAVLMLCERYDYSRGDALRMAGLFNAASYLATVPGGLVIDRVRGSHRCLGAGMALLALGYATLSLSGYAALCAALGPLLLGHALFKPSTQAVLSRLYEPQDPRLDAAQVAFFLVVNAGGTVGAISAGLLLRHHDFHTVCTVAAAAMLAGFAALTVGRRTLRLRPKEPHAVLRTGSSVARLAPRKRFKLLVEMTLAMMICTVGFGQVEGSLLLWAQDRTDRVFFGFEIPASWFVGLPSLLVLILAPAQLVVLPKLQRRVSTPRLIAWGLGAVGVAFAVLIPPAMWSDGHRVSMAWLVSCMTLLVIGELLVAPLGLSMILQVTPPRFVGVTVGVWYGARALGYWLAGEIGAESMKLAMGWAR